MRRKVIRKKGGYNRWPLYVVLLMIGMMMLLVSPTVAANNAEEKSAVGPAWEEVRVEKGDTLWAIARRYQKPRQDVRHLIHLIMDANDLEPSEPIYPGQILLIPVD